MSCVRYAFGTAILGCWDMGVDHPYSNVRMHAGPSNHYFLPMGMLHKLPAFERMWPPVLPWAGGAVLVHESNARYFLTKGGVPGDVSADLSPRTLALLRKSGHCAKQFFAVAKRFLDKERFTDDESVLGGDGQMRVRDFVPFTIPAFELRRLVSEGTRRQLVPHLPRGGDLPAARTTVHVTTGADGAVISCVVRRARRAHPLSRFRSTPCADDEPVLLPRISPLALTFLPIYNAYPLIDGDVRAARSASCAMVDGVLCEKWQGTKGQGGRDGVKGSRRKEGGGARLAEAAPGRVYGRPLLASRAKRQIYVVRLLK